MRELLRRGADATVGATSPLFDAIRKQNLVALEILLDHGLSVDSLDEGHFSREMRYALNSRRVYALLGAAFPPVSSMGIKDSLPLFRCLVERGADLYLPLNDDETLIHFLFEFTQHDVFNVLLQEPDISRIDPNRRDQHGRTVLMAACRWEDKSYAKSVYQDGPGPLGSLLDHGADATLVDNEGRTALHHLLDNPMMADDLIVDFINRDEAFPILLKKDAMGLSPLHYALRTLRPPVCELLVSKGADLLESMPDGRNPLHSIAGQCLATRREQRSETGFGKDLGKDYFETCLTLWKRCVSSGVSVNGADENGNTPLHVFLASEEKEMRGAFRQVCHLAHWDKLFPADSGVDVFAVNNEGETALHVVARRQRSCYSGPNHDKMLFEALMRKGLDPLREDRKGRSALDVASACGRTDIVQIMKRKTGFGSR